MALSAKIKLNNKKVNVSVTKREKEEVKITLFK